MEDGVGDAGEIATTAELKCFAGVPRRQEMKEMGQMGEDLVSTLAVSTGTENTWDACWMRGLGLGLFRDARGGLLQELSFES